MVQQVYANIAQQQGLLRGDWMDYNRANSKAIEPLLVGVPLCLFIGAMHPPLSSLSMIGVGINIAGAALMLGANVAVLAANKVTNLAAEALGL